MPDYEHLLQAQLPDALDEAYESLNQAYDEPEQLLHADVSRFEPLSCCVFCYFGREDVFYVNRAGRALLSLKTPTAEASIPKAPPIFWLEDDAILSGADQFVITRRQSIANARELVTLSWGKTWLEGTKFPILSLTGQPLALMFAGVEIAPSCQIRQIAKHFQVTQTGFGGN